MKVLGVIFDSKMQCKCLKSNKKATSALHAIRLIKHHFTSLELRTLITSNFYSILFYNSEVWHLPKLNTVLVKNLLTASANALKLCTPFYDHTMSYDFFNV